MQDCRICLEQLDHSNSIVGNLCKCKDVYLHEACAVKWFTPRIFGVSRGKVIESNWDTSFYATCEVCNYTIDDYFVKKCVLNLKRDAFKVLKNTWNSLNVPQENVVERSVSTHRIGRIQHITHENTWFLSCFRPNT